MIESTEKSISNDFKRMYDSLTDPEERQKARREEEKKQRAEEKINDYGL